MAGARLLIDAAMFVLRSLGGKQKSLNASARAFNRGAGFEGHAAAVAHESAVLGRAASRLRQAIVAQKDQLQKLHSAEPPRTGKGRQHKSPQAKLDSLQRALKKNQDEVEHLDRLILSNKRFLPTEEPSGIISPSPARAHPLVTHWTRF